MSVAGKLAVVTGAGSGIGRATAELFAANGATVVLADRDADATRNLAKVLQGSVAIETDVGDADDVARLFSEVEHRYGRLDILVNNAGVGAVGTVVDLEVAEWDRLMAINLRGMYLCAKHAIPLMERAGRGAIVNIGSYTALSAIPARAAYVASKGAIASLTRAMALDHASQNVRVNCVAPGTIETPWFGPAFESNKEPEELRRQLAARCPMNRMGKPEEIAEAVLWLASDRASFATGSVLAVDGGASIW
ncbi:SDR family oxidoreductase [Cupriavidus pauculus]|uniref:Short-chain dehydrogenase n=1 Tax=Cupriavidus pauculus TaxID=82633 RepID=A0A2N5C3D2_9BURK|nr:SDR family oxidoreductase [Cupriavidus pauculus]PLP96724.1 short-chain dehydrogenase [Cupriavidus pauculus]